MKYQVECITAAGPVAVLIEERSAETAALSAIEVLAAQELEIALNEVVRVFYFNALTPNQPTARKAKLTKRERARVDWLAHALLRRPSATPYFTVAGIYEGTLERYGTEVSARDQHEAMLLAVQRCDEDNSGCGDDMSVLGIMEGRHKMLDCQYGMDQYADRFDGHVNRSERDVLLDDGIGESDGAVLHKPFTVFSSSGTFHIFAANALAAEHRVVADRIAGVVTGHMHNLLAEIKHWVYRWAYDDKKGAFKKQAVLFDLN